MWSDKAIEAAALKICPKIPDRCVTPCAICKTKAALVLDAAGDVDGHAQWNEAIEAAAKYLDEHWDGERGDAIRSLKRP